MHPRQPRKTPTQKPYLVFQPDTYKAMKRGIDLLVNAVSPTLGPMPRFVAIDRVNRQDSPELLDDGATIARRIIQLKDKDADIGAMFLRQVLWRMHEDIGDGTASAAVLFKSIFDQGIHYITSGGNAIRLREYLKRGENIILDYLSSKRTEVHGKEVLAKIAEGICYDPIMARLLGEIIDITGEYGLIEIRQSHSQQYEREYIEGMYWDKGVASRDMVIDPVTHIIELENASVLISDLEMNDPQSLLPFLDEALKHQIGNLLLIGSNFSGSVISLLFAANKDPQKLKVVAVKTPGISSTDQAAAIQDLAILTGGLQRFKAAGDTINGVKLSDLGHARKARAGYDFFSIIGGKGDARVLRNHITSLQVTLQDEKEYNARKKISERIGKLMGGAATLFIPAATDSEIKLKKELAERTTHSVQAALREGVVPGGGVAFLDCREVLHRRLNESNEPEERVAYQILIKALEVPTRVLISNSGMDANEVMAEIRLAGPGYGYDVLAGKVVRMAESGIFDVYAAVKSAVRSAVSGAGLALTTDVIVHRRKVLESMEP